MYQPKPIIKQRPAPPASSVELRAPQSAIILNLEAITSANESQSQKEAETASVLSQFTPLSISPVGQSGEFFPAGRERVREVAQPSLHELGHSSAETQSLDASAFKPKRRGLWLSVALIIVGLGLVAAKVGFQAFMSDPVGATQRALNVAPPQVIEPEGPQIEEVIERGELSVSLKEPTRYERSWVIIEGSVDNSTQDTQGEVKLKLSLTFEGAPPFQESFDCCDAPKTEEERAAWLKAQLKRTKSKAKSDEEGALDELSPAQIPSQSSASFMRLYRLPARVKELPQVSVEVTFHEKISD